VTHMPFCYLCIEEKHMPRRPGRTTAQQKRTAFELKRKRIEAERRKNGDDVVITGRSIWAVASPFRSTEKAFDNPEHLWKAACDYFKWVDGNPDYEIKPMSVTLGGNQGSEIQMIKVPKKQPYTIRELCVFIGVSPGYFKEFKNKKRDGWETWGPAIRAIENIVFSQQFNGAASGFFNANIIVRALHLVEKTKTEVVDNRDKVAELFPEEIRVKKKK
jgi:hypothetical protein